MPLTSEDPSEFQTSLISIVSLRTARTERPCLKRKEKKITIHTARVRL